MSKPSSNEIYIPSKLLPWVENELENVKECPVCGQEGRTKLYDHLIDNVFYVANGEWTMYLCDKCGSGYLDPRPDIGSIGKAYGSYFTHFDTNLKQVSSKNLNIFRAIRRKVVNSYLNNRFGTNRKPDLFGFGYIVKLLPSYRHMLDSEFRYLPKQKPGQLLLDIGCGNGAFLHKAKEAGWKVVGIDFDPKAVAVAVRNGIEAKVGSIDCFDDKSSCFDAITLSHVIEHVHDPISLLKSIYRLLKPGGFLYLETPNINSYGSEIYGRNWRGIETPRHLVIFNKSSIDSALNRVGFENVNFKYRAGVSKGIFFQSENIENFRDPMDKSSKKSLFVNIIADILNLFGKSRSEFVTVVARKPI